MDMKQAMKERHMVRKYTDKPIPEKIVEKLNERVRENNERYGLSIRLMTNDGSAVPGVIKLILAKGVNNFFITPPARATRARRNTAWTICTAMTSTSRII